MYGAITNLRCAYWLHAILRNLDLPRFGGHYGLPHFQWTHNHTNQLSWPPRTVRG